MKKESGFTLIELMIVIAIVGILAALALPKFLQVKYNHDVKVAQEQGLPMPQKPEQLQRYESEQAGKNATPVPATSTATPCRWGSGRMSELSIYEYITIQAYVAGIASGRPITKAQAYKYADDYINGK